MSKTAFFSVFTPIAIVGSFGIGRFKNLFSSINSLMEEELLRPSEVAKRFGVSVKTLWKWQKKGIIKAVRLPTDKPRHPKSEVMEHHNIHLSNSDLLALHVQDKANIYLKRLQCDIRNLKEYVKIRAKVDWRFIDDML